MERFGEKLRAAVSQMQNGVSNRMLENSSTCSTRRRTILDYMNRPIVVLDEPEALFARMDSRNRRVWSRRLRRRSNAARHARAARA